MTQPLDLSGLAAALPIIPTSTTAPAIVFPSQLVPSPSSHPILGVHISNYIKFQVTSTGEHYSKWRQIVTFLLTIYQALDHITDGAAPPNPDDLWRAVDIHISLWFMATLSDDLYRLVSGTDGWACSTWTRLARFFLDNEGSRYLYLSKAFRSTPRGDLSISTYASKLQGIANDLAASVALWMTKISPSNSLTAWVISSSFKLKFSSLPCLRSLTPAPASNAPRPTSTPNNVRQALKLWRCTLVGVLPPAPLPRVLPASALITKAKTRFPGFSTVAKAIEAAQGIREIVEAQEARATAAVQDIRAATMIATDTMGAVLPSRKQVLSSPGSGTLLPWGCRSLPALLGFRQTLLVYSDHAQEPQLMLIL
jgi:hypothetical protein